MTGKHYLACLRQLQEWNGTKMKGRDGGGMSLAALQWREIETMVIDGVRQVPAVAVCDFAAKAQPACGRNRSGKDCSLPPLKYQSRSAL
jgi:hypothetical protein